MVALSWINSVNRRSVSSPGIIGFGASIKVLEGVNFALGGRFNLFLFTWSAARSTITEVHKATPYGTPELCQRCPSDRDSRQ